MAWQNPLLRYDFTMAGRCFIKGIRRSQAVPIPERLEDWIGEDYFARVVGLFIDELELVKLGFGRSTSART
ncbi:transposase [Paracoccus sulfuroxidans]|uniref:Transposase n=1 Tax=Paracoccus sulfuroxidans TaxID=384678 RepID=A0A562NP14_9RHOB|nr:transposase [Paracoccus sulfuroxidans]